LLLQVEAYTTHIKKPIHLAIMGCSVNGIGECKKADIGVFGNKTHNIIYKKGKPYKTVKHNITFNELKKLLDNFK
jgi:(E)-4-hydroxy-3-methylbut-2-enyl-diphosphate synthase